MSSHYVQLARHCHIKAITQTETPKIFMEKTNLEKIGITSYAIGQAIKSQEASRQAGYMYTNCH